jgi:hypothetical protein
MQFNPSAPSFRERFRARSNVLNVVQTASTVQTLQQGILFHFGQL